MGCVMVARRLHTSTVHHQQQQQRRHSQAGTSGPSPAHAAATHQQLLLHREGEAHLLPQGVLPGAALLSSSSGPSSCTGPFLRGSRLQLLQLLVQLLVLRAKGLQGGV
jgi:hypothetical protein